VSFWSAEIRALTFDIFGSVVDWRTSIIREGELLGVRVGLKVDWGAFADELRAGYQSSMAEVWRGRVQPRLPSAHPLARQRGRAASAEAAHHARCAVQRQPVVAG
jgi:2-haloacid dehalogenase